MTTAPWQLMTPIDAVVFDCDGTLSRLEGINELADYHGVGEEVTRMTEQAMGETGLGADLYQKRISMVKPSQKELNALGQSYYYDRVEDIVPVIQLLKGLSKVIYIVSAGLNPAVELFGDLLGISKEYVYAVDVYFDNQGNYIDYDRSSPLGHRGGKRDIINKIKETYPNVLHIGDGMNDYSAHDLVKRFVGYGGVYYRDAIAAKCDYYIKSASMTPLLPLGLTAQEYEQLDEAGRIVFYQGLDLITAGGVTIKQ